MGTGAGHLATGTLQVAVRISAFTRTECGDSGPMPAGPTLAESRSRRRLAGRGTPANAQGGFGPRLDHLGGFGARLGIR